MHRWVEITIVCLTALFWSGCKENGMCAEDVLDAAEALDFEVLPWDNGPEYTGQTGQIGALFDAQPQWASFLEDHELIDPVLSADFLSSDLLLYERMHDGCEWNVLFDGAFLHKNMRYVRARPGEDSFGDCNKTDPRHAILILEKVENASYKICEVE